MNSFNTSSKSLDAEIRKLEQRRLGIRMNPQAQFRGEPHGAQHAHRIFSIALLRVPDHANHAALQILDTTDVIQHREITHVVVECIDREIPPLHVLLDGAVDVVAEDPSLVIEAARLVVRILVVQTAERRHFNDLAPKVHVRKPESAADEPTISEQRLHVFRARVRRDIEVLGLATKEQVADTTANQTGPIAAIFQPVENLECIGTDVRPADAMIRASVDTRCSDVVSQSVLSGLGGCV